MIRILVADDQEVVRRALRLLLEQVAECSIAGEARDATELIAAIGSTAPDIVLLDWELPGFAAEQLLPLVQSDGPPIRVIAMSSRPEAEADACAAGVAGCINKGKPAEAALATIYEVLGSSI